MLKNRKLLGILLSIVMVLAFNIGGLATDYKYTQESGANYFVGTADKADSLEDCNELRTIVNDLGTLLGHSKMDGLYPKDGTTGGTLTIPAMAGGTGIQNNALNTITFTGNYTFELTLTANTTLIYPTSGTLAITTQKLDDWGTPDDNTDTNASITAHGLMPKLPNVATQFIDGTGAWAILATGDIPDLSATYQPLDTALTNISTLAYVSPSFIKLTANDTYTVRTLSEVKADLDLEIGTDVQAFDNALASISDLTYVSGSFIALTANDTYGVRTYAQTLSDIGAQASDASLTSIAGLTYASDSFIKVTAEDTYAIRTLAETKTDLSLNNVSNVATDDTAYNATSWNANTDAATKNAIRDKIETIGGYTNLTSFVDQTAWRVFYSNTDGDIIELALGADGTYLKSNGAAVAPTFTTPAGAGDVVKVGTPANSQVGVWTGDGTIEGAASFTYDGSNLQLTGDVGSTGTKITKGWFTDLLVTNAISGSVTGNAATVTSFTPASGSLTLSGADALTLTTTAATDVTLPTTGTLLANTVEDTTPELGGEMDAGAHTIGFTQQTITYDSGTTTVNWTLGNKAIMTFGAGNITTFAFTNPSNPCNVLIKIVQDGTGSRTVTAWDADIKWAGGGTAPTLSNAANSIDIVSFYWDGTNYFGVASLDFQ